MPDQADGLRSLFARRRPSLLITAGGDPCKADVAVRFAREAAVAHRATVLIDGSIGQLARACGAACRYELAQVVDGHVPLADVAKLLTPNLLLLPAARALARVGAFAEAEQSRLADAFATGIPQVFAAGGTADVQVDLVVVNAGEGRAAQALEAFGSDARVVVVVSNRPSSLRAAYAEVRSLAHDAGVENFEVVVPTTSAADDHTSDAGVAFANLANTARRFLGIELKDGGTVTVAPVSAPAMPCGPAQSSMRPGEATRRTGPPASSGPVRSGRVSATAAASRPDASRASQISQISQISQVSQVASASSPSSSSSVIEETHAAIH